MIQIYSPENKNYEQNGDSSLFPTSCIGTFKLNGVWEVEIEHPIDDEGRWRFIKENAVLSVPTFMGERQLFRIYEYEKDHDYVKATAQPIFLDAANMIFYDNKRIMRNAKEWLRDMLAVPDNVGGMFSGESDCNEIRESYYVRKNFIECLNGDDENSFVNRYELELLYDNFHVIANMHIGEDRGVRIAYGKNIASIDESVDMTDIVTRAMPIGYNGRYDDRYKTDPSFSQYVYSDIADVYPHYFTKVIKFENLRLKADDPNGDGFETEEELFRYLRGHAITYMRNGGDKPKVTMNINMVDLAQTDEYKDYKQLERVFLGDTVHCHDEKLGIDVEARVIELSWDCIRNCISNVVVGSYKPTFFDNINSTVGKIDKVIDVESGTVNAEVVQGVFDANKVMIRNQNTVARKQEARAILFEDEDPDSELYGALSVGTQGVQLAKEKGEDGEWKWETAMTSAGIVANAIISGMLSDKTGRNYWDLDTGMMEISANLNIGGADNSIGMIRVYDYEGEQWGLISFGDIDMWNATANFRQLYVNYGFAHNKFIIGESIWYDDIYSNPPVNKDRPFIKTDQALHIQSDSGNVFIHNPLEVLGNIILRGAQIDMKNGAYLNGNVMTADGTVRLPIGSYSDTRKVSWLSARGDNDLAIRGLWGSTSTWATHTVTTSSSDVRLKENIYDADINALDIINQIKIRQFDWKNDKRHQKIGFIADELETIDEDLSVGGGYDDDGAMNVKSVDSFYLQGYIVKAMQEQQSMIDALQKKLDEAIRKIEALESDMK